MIKKMLNVDEIYSVFEAGTTEPLKCRLSDGVEAYVKYPYNRGGNLVLVNEYLGSSIAQMLGVNSWEFGLCNLSETTRMLFSDEQQSLDSRNCGICFFSVAKRKLIPKILWEKVNASDVAKIILLDHILLNLDRHEGNVQFDLEKEEIVSLDYSHILCPAKTLVVEYDLKMLVDGMKEDGYLFNDIMVANSSVYDDMFVYGQCTEKVIMNEADKMTHLGRKRDISDIINNLPEKWKDYTESDTMKKLLELVTFRVEHLDKIAEMIVNERRKR